MAMPTFRITTGLSLLALLVGIAGTAWLTECTQGWRGPAPLARSPTRTMHLAMRHDRTDRPSRPPPRVIGAVSHRLVAPDELPAAPATPELQPISMPDVHTLYATLRGHLAGRVVLSVQVDGAGQVTAAGVARSSGDPVLDSQALRLVQAWRFAVPPGYPDGLRGELPMRFDAAPDRLQ